MFMRSREEAKLKADTKDYGALIKGILRYKKVATQSRSMNDRL
jgi:hypothetical protein